MSSQPNSSISQIVAVSYPAVIADKNKKPENQWAESAFMKAMQKMGMIEKKNLGPTIEFPIDFRRNPGGDFLATDLTPVSLAKTEVLSTASYTPAELSIPVVWSKGDDAKNPSENQKIAFVTALLDNAIQSHDDMIEEALFATSTDGFLGLATLVPTSGQGSVGGIDAATETMWRNPAQQYLADGSDMESVLENLFLDGAKGTGSGGSTKLIVSGADAQALFTSTQVGIQRFTNTSSLDASFTTVAFKNVPWVYSQYGGTKVYGLNKATRLVVSKQYFRDKGETKETDEANGFVFKIYSALQFGTAAKSRQWVAYQ
jgi:hypothetical protein